MTLLPNPLTSARARLMRLAVNVGFLFAELPYLERFLAVRAAGFDAVEFAWPD